MSFKNIRCAYIHKFCLGICEVGGGMMKFFLSQCGYEDTFHRKEIHKLKLHTTSHGLVSTPRKERNYVNRKQPMTRKEY